jgi:argininosuccinate lyase
VTLSDLALEDFQSFDSSLDGSVFEVLGVEKAVQAFQSVGSTAPAQVAKQVTAWKTRLA